MLASAAQQGLVATDITPNTTIGDVKGKVIIKVQLNGGYTGAWSQLAGANVWTNIYKEAAESDPYYSPMLYGTLPATNAGGTSASALTGDMNVIYSDCANPVVHYYLNNWTWKNGVKDNATDVLAKYASNYNSTEHKNFAMTYLGGCGAHSTLGAYTYYTNQVAETLNTL